MQGIENFLHIEEASGSIAFLQEYIPKKLVVE